VTKVSEIMTTSVITVDPGDSLRDAVEAFRAREVSGAPVTSGDGIIGVVSVTDILEFQATNPGVPVGHTEEESSTPFEAPAVWDEDEEDVPSAYFVDYWSDIGAEMTSRFNSLEGPEWDVLDNHSVAEVMTRTVIGIPSDATVQEAAKRLTDERIHRLLVQEDGHLVGIVTTTDVVRAVAEGRV
jgi:predicted transcriptional regulator